MIPVDQNRLGVGGDCFAACLASVLEIAGDQVPDFMLWHEGEDEVAWAAAFYQRVGEWLHGFSLGYLEIQVDGELDAVAALHPTCLWIGVGFSHQRIRHAVVMRGAELAHDPHPSRRGLAVLEAAGVFFTLDPAAARR